MPLPQCLKIKHLILFSRRNWVLKINLWCLVDTVHFKNAAIKKAWVAWHWQCRAVDLTLLHLRSYWFFFFSSFWHFTWFNPRFITLEMSSLRFFFLIFFFIVWEELSLKWFATYLFLRQSAKHISTESTQYWLSVYFISFIVHSSVLFYWVANCIKAFWIDFQHLSTFHKKSSLGITAFMQHHSMWWKSNGKQA